MLVLVRLDDIPDCGAYWRKASGGAWYTLPNPSFLRAIGAPTDEERGDDLVLGLGQRPGSYTLWPRESFVVVRLGDHFPGMAWHFEDK